MTTTRSFPATAAGSVSPGRTGAPRWAVWCAWATVLCTVPSGVWRMALGFGVDVGFTGRLGEMYTGVDIMVYVLALTVVSQAAAFLTLGLVRPWGETVPRWIPYLGGRRVPPLAAIVTASLGGVAVSGLCLFLALSPDGPLSHPDFPQGTAGTIMNVVYAPLLLWGPLVLILTAHYARRRGRHSSRQVREYHP
ncbi:hypothetical protein [Actinomadura sp. 7K507]|uniref:hypothetical protein n=1 Tax=Actinomadura sp. 7K507 TaxID=2530365 RepID=UPI00104728B8|nr:hypothetical protein [Actinomadura sp. 7K507]TDC85562.1 hypothetical protein E1285_25025 [Actinomadura sp. 7K507]